MSNGDDDSAEDASPEDEPEAVEAASFDDLLEEATAATAAVSEADEIQPALEDALDAIEAVLGAAETEADLDAVDGQIDAVADALETADLPEPDEDDEEAEDPRAAFEDRVETLRSDAEEARGPYAADVVTAIEDASGTLEGAEWTEDGSADAVDAVETFLESLADILEVDLAGEGDDPAAGVEALAEAATTVTEAELDPDGDAETIADLLEATDTLAADLEDAEEWSDLTTREQLDAHGFYDVLEHHKDYPPEWSALKVWEKRGRTDMVLLALEKLGMEYMEEHCLSALRRMGSADAVEPMLERAERRDRPAIEVLGKIGDEAPLETLLEYVDVDSDPQLQKVTIRALGEIGSEEATQAVADQLESDNPRIRSRAARSLGLIGDTRAIDPLADILENDEEGKVRGSAAWALNQIGTQAALEVLAEYADDRVYLVEAEARKADQALAAIA